MNFKIKEEVEFIRRECPTCWIQFWIPDALYRRSINDPQVTFHCPNGHKCIQPGRSIEERLTSTQAALDAMEKRNKENCEAHSKLVANLRGQITKLKKKAAGK